jgi:hypothetical protein
MVDELGRDGAFEGEQNLDSVPANDGVERSEATEPERIKLDDGEYSLDEVRTWKKDTENKSHWQKEYTQRDMSLAEQRKEVEQLYQLKDFFGKNPGALSEYEGLVKKYTQSVNAGGTTNPELETLKQELGSLKESMAVREVEGQISSEVKGLKEKYPNYFKDDPKLEVKLMKHAYDNGIMSMEHAFKSYMFDTVQGEKLSEGIKRGQQAAVKSKNLAQPSGSPAGVKGVNLKGSWSDVGRQIAERYSELEGE